MMQSVFFLMLLGFPYNLNNFNAILSRRDIIKSSNILTTMSLLNDDRDNGNNGNDRSNDRSNKNNNDRSNKNNQNDKNKIIKSSEDEEISFVGSISELKRKNSIYFYSGLNDESVFKLNSNILYLSETLEPGSEIDLHIQSGGGSLLPSLSTVDLIRTCDMPVNTFVEGYAASAATLISVVGAKRFMTKNSVMLIHQLKMGTEYSKFNEIEDYYSNAETLMEIVRNIYLENTKLDKELLSDLLNKDLWLNSTFCRVKNLVDIVI